ncbi:MAG: MFS transporter [Methanobacteriota archaeon]
MNNSSKSIENQIKNNSEGKLREIAQLTFAHLINDIYFPVLLALQPILITTLGFSYFQASLLPAMHSIISSLLQPVFGRLADKKGFRVSVSLSILFSGCGIALLGQLSDHYLIMLGCVALSALGHATFHPGALSKVNAVAATGKNRGKLTSFFVVGGNLGQALGPIIGGIALAHGGIPAITWLIIPAVIGALIILVHPIPDTHPIESSTTKNYDENWNPVLLLFAGSTLRMWVTLGVMTFLPTFLVLQGYKILDATTLVSVMLLAGVAGQITGGVISDRIGRKPIVVVTTLAAIPAFLGVLYSQGILLILSILIFGFLLWSSFAVTIAMAHEMMPSHIGLISGLFLGISMGVGGIGVSISGILADKIGLNSTLMIFPVIILVSAVLFWLVRYPGKIDLSSDH